MLSLLLKDSFTALICTTLILTSLQLGFAQVRSSSNYQIQSDSINNGGGLSESDSFSLESTIGESATGPSDSTTYSLRAGYQQMQEVFISISDATEVFLSPDIGGLSGGTSNGSTSVVVTTDSPSGYSLTITTPNDPAMNSPTDSIANYPATTTPDFLFEVGDGEAFFGFTVEGIHAGSTFRDNGIACNIGTGNVTDRCWRALTTNDILIARSGQPNHPNGSTTTVKFRVGVGQNAGVASGLYIATSTMTALPL